MHSGRGGPAAIEAPWDVMGQRGPIPPVPTQPPAKPPLDQTELDKAALLIRAAKNPMIFVGHGAVGAGPGLLELARRIGAPVVGAPLGQGHRAATTTPMR